MERDGLRRFCSDKRSAKRQTSNLFCPELLDRFGRRLHLARIARIFNQTDENHPRLRSAFMESFADWQLFIHRNFLDGRFSDNFSGVFGFVILAAARLFNDYFRARRSQSLASSESRQTGSTKLPSPIEPLRVLAVNSLDDYARALFLQFSVRCFFPSNSLARNFVPTKITCGNNYQTTIKFEPPAAAGGSKHISKRPFASRVQRELLRNA